MWLLFNIFTDETFFHSDALKPKCVRTMRKDINASAEVGPKPEHMILKSFCY